MVAPRLFQYLNQMAERRKVATVNDQVMFDLEDYCKEFSGESCDESKAACDIFADLPAFLCEMIDGSFEIAASLLEGSKG